jgi:hypothetical protein
MAEWLINIVGAGAVVAAFAGVMVLFNRWRYRKR